jgi:hypothetical protein
VAKNPRSSAIPAKAGIQTKKTLSNQRRYNRFYQSFFIQNFFVFLLLSFVKKKVTKEMTPMEVDTAPTGYPPVLIYSRELRDSLRSNRSSLFFLE